MSNLSSRRAFLGAAGAGSAALLAGCSGLSGGGGTGTLATRVSDRPGDIDDFSKCVITIDAIRVKPADTTGTATATGEDAGVEVIDVEGATADLVKLQGEKSQLVGEAELDTGDYQWLQLAVAGVDATLKDGGSANVKTPGQAPLKFNKAFEIRANTTTSFTVDFTPVKAGQSGMYVLQPVAKEVTVSYSDGSTDSGGNGSY